MLLYRYSIATIGGMALKVNLELLAELVAFKHYGTLSATAEHLMITQPTVTRGMKRLEEELGVTLFDRSISNHIKLNDTGLLAANEAAKLLKEVDDFTDKILNFDRLKDKFTVGSMIPGPLGFLNALKDQIAVQPVINWELVNPESVAAELSNLKEKVIFTDHEIINEEFESLYLGREYLKLEIDPFNPLAQKEAVTFKDLTGLTFLVLRDVGTWRGIVEDNIPQADFLSQNSVNAMTTISQCSRFPFFVSNLSQNLPDTVERFKGGDRVMVKIDDPNNQMEIYGTYLKSERRTVQPLLKAMSQAWPK